MTVPEHYSDHKWSFTVTNGHETFKLKYKLNNAIERLNTDAGGFRTLNGARFVAF
jgi:hypothetical protein